MVEKLLDYFIYLARKNDLLYTKMSCYIQRQNISHPKLQNGLQLNMTPKSQQTFNFLSSFKAWDVLIYILIDFINLFFSCSSMVYIYLIAMYQGLYFVFVKLVKQFNNCFALFGSIKVLHYFRVHFGFLNIKLSRAYKLIIVNNVC